MVAKGDMGHKEALDEMQVSWKNPAGGMDWYTKTKSDFDKLPADK